MSYTKAKIPDTVYHLTKRANVDQILADGKIKRFGDSECWFCRSIPDLLRYMEYTVLCTGKPYVDVDGSIKRYEPFVAEDYCVLKLTPKYREGNWYQWNQEIPQDSPRRLVEQAKEFSRLKIGYRGDLRFKDAQVLDMSQVMQGETFQDAADQDEKETNDLIAAEDCVEIAVYAANAPECCDAGDRVEALLGMLGANVIDDDIYHSEDEHPKQSM